MNRVLLARSNPKKWPSELFQAAKHFPPLPHGAASLVATQASSRSARQQALRVLAQMIDAAADRDETRFDESRRMLEAVPEAAASAQQELRTYASALLTLSRREKMGPLVARLENELTAVGLKFEGEHTVDKIEQGGGSLSDAAKRALVLLAGWKDRYALLFQWDDCGRLAPLGWEMKPTSAASAPNTIAPTNNPRELTPTIWHHGGKSYSADGRGAKIASSEMHSILQLFLDSDEAHTTRELENLVANVSTAIDAIVKRFGADAVRRPAGDKGSGYFIRVRALD